MARAGGLPHARSQGTRMLRDSDHEAEMPATTKPAPTSVLPTLSLLALSDSFSGIWTQLAAECGMVLERVGRESVVPEHDGSRVVMLSVGGVEPQMDEALRSLMLAGHSPAVVAGLPDHHLAQQAVRGGAAE